MELILASKSARRQEILKNLHVPYRIFTEDVDETLPPDISPRDAVICLARKKAYACRDAMGSCFCPPTPWSPWAIAFTASRMTRRTQCGCSRRLAAPRTACSRATA